MRKWEISVNVCDDELNEQKQESNGGVTERNMSQQAITESQVIQQSSVSIQKQNNLRQTQVNQQNQKLSSGSSSSQYFLDQLNLTRKRKWQSSKKKNFEG